MIDLFWIAYTDLTNWFTTTSELSAVGGVALIFALLTLILCLQGVRILRRCIDQCHRLNCSAQQHE